MFVVDTNVLIYAADADSPFHQDCRKLVERWRGQATPWFTTWPIAYEFLRVVTHARVFRRPWPLERAWGFLEAIAASPGLEFLAPSPRHGDVLAEVVTDLPHLHGNLLHDAHTAVLMKEHGLRKIYTRDTDFHKFPFLEPLEPVAPAP